MGVKKQLVDRTLTEDPSVQEATNGRCDVSCARPSIKDFIEVPLACPGVLVPGASVSLPCWLRGPDTPGRNQVKMLFYYESTEPSHHMK